MERGSIGGGFFRLMVMHVISASREGSVLSCASSLDGAMAEMGERDSELLSFESPSETNIALLVLRMNCELYPKSMDGSLEDHLALEMSF